MESLRDNLKVLFNDLIVDLDNKVKQVGESQCELDQELDSLIELLDQIKLNNEFTKDISDKAKKLTSIKRRLTLIHTILQNSSSRCKRLMVASKAASDQIMLSMPSPIILDQTHPSEEPTTSVASEP